MRRKYVLCAILFTALAFAFCTPAFARPANPRPFTVTQPGGEKIVLCEQGDEFAHWTATKIGGYAVVCHGGSWYFAKEENGVLVSTGVLYSTKTKAPAGCKENYSPAKTATRRYSDSKSVQSSALQRRGRANLTASASNATVIQGDRKILFVRVNFNNETIQYPDKSNYATMFKLGDNVKSVAQYYSDQSNGLLKILPCKEEEKAGTLLTVTVDIDHPGKKLEYKTYLEECGGDENKADVMAHKEEVALVNKVLAKITETEGYGTDYFAQYDTDKNGVITQKELCVYMILAGYEDNPCDERPNAVWAHAWFSYDEKSGDEHRAKASGKVFAAWAMNGERVYDNTSKEDKPCTMLGIICHELGHQLLSLPDLYDTAKSALNKGVGDFSIMAHGLYGRENKDEQQGSCPVSFDAWCKAKVGWATPITKITTEEAQTLTFKKDSPLRIEAPESNDSSKQYFLADLRDPNSGWDKGLAGNWETDNPKAGILVLRIDGEREKIAEEEEQHSELGVATWTINDSSYKYEGNVVHQGVLPVCADNSLKYGKECNNAITNETLWYGENKMELTPDTTPNTDFYSDLNAMKPEVNSYISLTNISNSNADEMTATLKESSAGSGSSSGGCNSGFGAIMLLFVIALPAVKKCGKKAA